jgi:hypothetical protein
MDDWYDNPRLFIYHNSSPCIAYASYRSFFPSLTSTVPLASTSKYESSASSRSMSVGWLLWYAE